MTGEQQLIGQGREAAREIVGAAVALRLADQAHDRPGIDGSGFDQPIEFGHVARRAHGHFVNADFHPSLLLAEGAGPRTADRSDDLRVAASA